MFTQAQLEMLSAKLEKSNVRARKQGGRQVSYIEGWHAIAEANRIFGFGDWSRETVELRCVAEKEREIGERKEAGWGVTYIAKVRITVGDVIRDGSGSGHGIDRDLGQAHESALKEAETDAMKRALMTFGNPFGLALYDKDQANVETAAKGTEVAIADQLIAQIQAKKSGNELDLLAKEPDFVAAYNDLPTTEKARVVKASQNHRAKLNTKVVPMEAA